MINGQTLEQEVNEPKHYRSHESGIEAIEITRFMQFDLGNCWKYCMRYRDKGTPKKDLKKAVWYINDFVKYFVNPYDNGCTYVHNLTENVIEKMCKVIDAETVPEIKSMFEQILMLTTQNLILNKCEFDRTVYELEQFGNAQN